MHHVKPVSFLLAAFAAFAAGQLRAAPLSYTTLNYPGAADTLAWAVSGNIVVGGYIDPSAFQHGFYWNGSNYTPLNDPLAHGIGSNAGTVAQGISGNRIVGWYTNSASQYQGFIYDMSTSTYTPFNDPLGTNGSQALGISGSEIVGFYDDSSGHGHGYFYNGTTFTTIDDPLSFPNPTVAYGISGNYIVGSFNNSTGTASYGFLYNILTSSFTTLSDPSGPTNTVVTGISGNIVVGAFTASLGKYQGFEYNIATSTYTTFNDPLGTAGTVNAGISGSTVVGWYTDSQNEHGFIAVPEPPSVALFGSGAIAAAVAAFRRKIQNQTRKAESWLSARRKAQNGPRAF